MIKLIAIDVDGTLVNSTKRISNATKKAIEAAKQKGIHIALASGRPFSGMRKYIKQLDLQSDQDFAVTQNGSYIHMNKSGELVAKNCIKRDDLKVIEKYANAFNLQLSYMDSKHFYTASKSSNIYTLIDSYIAKRRLRYMPFDNWHEDKTFGRSLLMGSAKRINYIAFNTPVELTDNYYCVKTERFLFEIMSKNANKGVGVKELSEKLGFKDYEVMAIGNELNDIPMLDFAGLSVAMKNSRRELFDHCDYITDSNNNDGVAKVIFKLLENQKIDFTK